MRLLQGSTRDCEQSEAIQTKPRLETSSLDRFALLAMTERVVTQVNIAIMQEQPPPAPDRSACNCFALRQAARHVTQIYDRHMAKEGLRTTQFSVLAKLSRLERVSINELAKSMVMDRTTLGRAIRPLERGGLLTIGPGDDGRTRSLRLTPAGEARLEAAAGRWREAQAEFETAFGAREAADLRSTLNRVIAST
jgi:DNA-binding MarR family transcriptional regulator